mgnify:CR=1 FL=1
MSTEKKQEKKAVDPFFAVIAKVYGVPASGISAIGEQPYLNKDGRLFLLKKLRTGKSAVKAIRFEFIKMSTSLIEPAVVKKTIVFKDGLEVEAMGEASQDSVGSQSVKQTLNMVAETRALNRAIWQAIGGDIMEQVQKNLETMELEEKDRDRIMEAGRVSYEEMERPTKPSETDDRERKLYQATAERIDAISSDEEALKRALEKINEMPLEAQAKGMIEEKILIALSKLRTAKGDKKAPKKKTAKTMKVTLPAKIKKGDIIAVNGKRVPVKKVTKKKNKK